MAPILAHRIEGSPAVQPEAMANHGSTAPLEEYLLTTLGGSPFAFLQPDPKLQNVSLHLGKDYLDPIASSVSSLQAERAQRPKRKRKRGQSDPYDKQAPLRLKQVYLEGFGVQQVWEQVKRVLEANATELERELKQFESSPKVGRETNGFGKVSTPQINDFKSLGFDEDGFELGSPDKEDSEGRRSENDKDDLEDAEGSAGGDVEEIADRMANEENDEAHQAQQDTDEDDLMADSNFDTSSSRTFVADKNGLNDGFFSIEDFNRQSEFLEQQDARGDPDDGGVSDEEDIDWAMDPLSASNWTNGISMDEKPQRKRQENTENIPDEVEELASDEEDDGPIFGNADLDADESESEAGEGDIIGGANSINGLENTNDIRYADFFEPPLRKATNGKFDRALPKTQPSMSLTHAQPDEEDMQRTMDAVRRDIFEDESVGSANESDVPSGTTNPLSSRSNHQKRQAKLAAEIRRLEAANVAKRDWQLSGEARATDRPLNSLLEEDLDFERVGKPVPVITNEVSEDIESLIKRRILAREFDEVIRRRPDNLVTGAGKDLRRGRFELDDTKPKQSLAEIYEAEHLQNADPEGFVSKSDAKLKAQHAEIERLWKDVSAKLDALTSWHYKPAPPSASINIVTDAPTISMEDARPTAGGEAAGVSMLAPQEVYRAGEATDKRAEIMPKGGAAVRRDEMSKEDKRRRRRREKERIRKAGGVVERTDQKAKTTNTIIRSQKAKEQDAVVGQLKKGGVRVIGRKGDLQDVEGREVKDPRRRKGAGSYKL